MWTTEEIADAQVANIRRSMARGWKYEGGLLTRGNVTKRPSSVMPSKSGDPDWNPARDAFALRLGGVLVGPNRYRCGSLLLDKHGAVREDGCPECGSVDGEYKFWVPKARGNPFAKLWEKAWTYCRRCVTSTELADNERRVNATPQRRR